VSPWIDGDGDDHVEDLLEGEVAADLVSALRGGEERSAGGNPATAGEARRAVELWPCSPAAGTSSSARSTHSDLLL
jgi:hypothetical protein